MTDFKAWLERHGLEAYAQTFADNHIDFRVLSKLSEADLKELGLTMGHRKLFLEAVAQWSASTADSVHQEQSASPTQAERRQLTILFCDLIGSTQLARELDPETLRDVMQRYQQTCRAAIERFDGHVAQYLGDGLMVYFGWPRAHENDAERAVRAGLEIVDAMGRMIWGGTGRALGVRIGVATGTVVVGETGAGDASVPKLAVGETPNLASRLLGVAGANQVVIAPATHRLVRGVFEFQDLGAHVLKGILEPVQAHAVISVAQTAGRYEAARAGAPHTAMIGREEEGALLWRRWQQAKGGEGQVALLSGEAGIGKSRILHTLLERLGGESHERVRLQCSPFHTQAALHPLIDFVPRAAGFTREDSPTTRLDKLESWLMAPDESQPLARALLAALLTLPGDRYPQLTFAPQKQLEKTFEALAGHLFARAAVAPLIVVLEDAHWIDSATQAFLDMLVESLATQPVLLLVSYRPEYTAPWSAQAHVTTLVLNRLTRRQAQAMVDKITGGKALPAEVLEQIITRTDGVPLFLEELTLSVLESTVLKDVGTHYELTAPLGPLAIPATLHDSLMARLDRVAQMKIVAQLGACVGREFGYELLLATGEMGEAELRDALEKLVQSGLVFRRGEVPQAVYTFKHALVQDAAYESLLKTRRSQLHGLIARAIETRLPQVAQESPQTLARHLTESANHAPAIEWWHKAAQQAAQRQAITEAVDYLKRGIGLCHHVPEGEDRYRLELSMQLALGANLNLITGWAEPDTGRAYTRAIELCELLGDDRERIVALWGMSAFHMVSGNQKAGISFATESLDIALGFGDRDQRIVTEYAVGIIQGKRGYVADSCKHLELVWTLCERRPQTLLTQRYGMEFTAFSGAWLCWYMWCLGYPDRALRSRVKLT